MPNYLMSSKDVQAIQKNIASKDRKIEQLSARQKVEKAIGTGIEATEIIGTGLLMGALRGKFEKSDGSFNIPGVNFDAELATGLAVTGISLFNGFGKKYSNHAFKVGLTILAGYGRGMARNWVKTGQFRHTAVGALPGAFAFPGMVSGGVAGDPNAQFVEAMSQSL